MDIMNSNGNNVDKSNKDDNGDNVSMHLKKSLDVDATIKSL